MIIETADDIIDLCSRAVEENNAEKRARIAAGETLTNEQKSKAVLVTYRNVGNKCSDKKHHDGKCVWKQYEYYLPIEPLSQISCGQTTLMWEKY